MAIKKFHSLLKLLYLYYHFGVYLQYKQISYFLPSNENTVCIFHFSLSLLLKNYVLDYVRSEYTY